MRWTDTNTNSNNRLFLVCISYITFHLKDLFGPRDRKPPAIIFYCIHFVKKK